MNSRFGVLLLLLVMLQQVSVSQEYVLVGWNDLGMHCSNKDFSKMAVLPPFNNIVAQLIRKSPNQLPQLVTAGFSVEYSIPGNTYSVGKTNFWTYAQQLFGLSQPLTPNIGLTGKGLTGNLDTIGNHFKATGIPITPFADNDLVNENPYQLIHLVARLIATGDTVAATDVVIPVSNEVGCVQSGCHASETAILSAHESVPGFNRTQPILCATCHASNALGTTGDPEAQSFSYRIHSRHQFITPTNSLSTCYKCHPGPNTRCLRDVMGTNTTNPLTCQNCHGTMAQVASSINSGRRPWLDEPRCGSTACHGSGHAEEAGKLYRESQGHGGLYCSACHGSPHAILPTIQSNDNLQSIRLQGVAGPLRDCNICHSTPPTSPGPHGLTYLNTTTANIQMSTDWNMVSVPVTVGDSRSTILFPTATSNAYTYVSAAGYVRKDTLLNRLGYWIKFPSAQTVSITGFARLHDTVDVVQGWNLVGSISVPIQVASIVQMPTGIVASGYYAFSGSGYIQTNTIEPGKAYWVKVSTSGRLGF
jgi:hypothetical protein